ncbi:4-alpha-glucanotransferase, partial [Methylobacterium frigidaeris]
ARLFDALVAPGSDFLREFRPFAERLARVGMVTGLARSALKCTLPGLPDIYQGTEFWDFSFVDPDNRRPVDYAEREAALSQDVALEDLLASWPDGRIKQAVLARLLADRAAFPSFYAEADYAPVAAEGEGADRVVAFLRQDATAGSEAGDLLVAVPRRVAAEDGPRLAGAFAGTALPVPEGSVWRDLVTGDEVRAEGGRLPVERLFARLPLAVLRQSAS